jgi:Tetratricopeptide repeat
MLRAHHPGRRPPGQWGLVALVLVGSLLGPPAAGQPPPPTVTPPPTEQADPFAGEVIRARILARLGRVAEALAIYETLLARRPDDRALREDYGEVLIDAGLLDRAAATLDQFLRDDPDSLRLRRLRARVDLERDDPGHAVGRLAALLRRAPDDRSIATDLAHAQARAGQWRAALSLYDDILERDPENEEIRSARREIALAHAPRVEVLQRTLLQPGATHQTQEVTWMGWLADRWWLRTGGRHGGYVLDPKLGASGFHEDVQTALATVGYSLSPRWSASSGLEESQRGDVFRTTFRLGGVFDDGKLTYGTLDTAAREVLTNPVTAIPLNGATDRVTLDLSRRLAGRLVGAAHYSWRHFTVSGQELGTEWEAAGRAEIELLKSPASVTLTPQTFFSQYSPTAPSPLRDTVTFIRRQDIIATGLLVGLDLWPGARAQLGAVGRRDLFRAITSWEATGDVRWRLRAWLEIQVLYTRNTESLVVGGKEESFAGRISVLY